MYFSTTNLISKLYIHGVELFLKISCENGQQSDKVIKNELSV